MKIRCPHCQRVTIIDDDDIIAYLKRQNPASPAKCAAAKLNASKPRPGSIGNQRARKKPTEP